MNPAPVVALLGAESTGKTTLAEAVGARLSVGGRRVVVVPEYLRDFCLANGRVPRRDEQAGIAAEQTRRIAAARAGAELVIADTTAVMVAVYSDLLFGDTSLYDDALAAQRAMALTLLTLNDVPWQADGLMRDGPHVREPVLALVRAALARGGVRAVELAGSGEARLEAALVAVAAAGVTD